MSRRGESNIATTTTVRGSFGRVSGPPPCLCEDRIRMIPRRHCSRAPKCGPPMVVGAREPPVPSVSSHLGRPLAGRESEVRLPGPADRRAAPAGGPNGGRSRLSLGRLIQQSVLRPPAVTAVTSRWCRCALYGSAARHLQRLTAKLTAKRANSCRSLATSADEDELCSCSDGWRRTALDGRGRVRSPLLYPLSYRGGGFGSSVRWLLPDCQPALRRLVPPPAAW
jgi:hypothetical protein